MFVSRIILKTASWIFTKFGGKVAHGPWKKPLGVFGNISLVRWVICPIRIGIGLRLGLGLGLGLGFELGLGLGLWLELGLVQF